MLFSAGNITGWSERQQKPSITLLAAQGGGKSRKHVSLRSLTRTVTFLNLNADQPHPEDNGVRRPCVNAHSQLEKTCTLDFDGLEGQKKIHSIKWQIQMRTGSREANHLKKEPNLLQLISWIGFCLRLKQWSYLLE